MTPNRTSATICPYCRDELPGPIHPMACETCGGFEHPEFDPDYPCEPPALWTCHRCSTTMHQECYDELSTCTTLGCSGRERRHPRVRATATATARTTLTPEEYARSRPPWWIFILGPMLLVAFVLTITFVIKWLMGLG